MPAPLGQHFLKIPGPARALVRALELDASDVIVEVGPGHGELTRHLAAAPHARIVCIERDVSLAAGLVRTFESDPSVTVVHGDVRELLQETVTSLGTDSWKLAGNIPYYLTSYLVRLMGDLEQPPVRAALLMQKEVAERISALPGSFTKLAAFTGAWADTSIVTTVPRTAFSPPPKVDSAVLSFIRKQAPVSDRASYETVTRMAFSQPRKVLLNNLSATTPKEVLATLLEKVGLQRTSRPQDLSVESLEQLSLLHDWTER